MENSANDFTPSPYQQAIFDFIEKGQGNAVISAVAGSGKTSTICKSIALIEKSKQIIFIAFNKKIVEEIERRVPNYVNVRTVHGLGWSAIQNAYKINKPVLNNNKYSDICKVVSPTWDLEQVYQDKSEIGNYIGRVLKLVDLARVNMVHNANQLSEIAEKYSVDLENGECEKAIDLLRIGQKNLREFDFTDMIYIPALNNLRLFQYDFVFVDECQDLNKCQQLILKNLIKPNGGRFVAVGDPKQAIYGFAGADSESFENLTKLPNTTEFPLSVCYRCGKEIVKFAQKIVPHLSYPDSAIDGVVRNDGKINEIKPDDYVLCRNTAPLVSLCLKLIASGKKATILGGDIGKNIINVIEQTKTRDTDNMFLKLEQEYNKILAKICKKKGLTKEDAKEERTALNFREKIIVIEVICNQQGYKTTAHLVGFIAELFSDIKKGIMLATIHKSKGLEADRVHIICDYLSPSKYAKKDWEKEQEQNLMYVAYTRAKKELIFNTEFVFEQDK